MNFSELTEKAFDAARAALVAAHKEGDAMPRGLLVITYDPGGAFRICAEGAVTHEAIGIMQRCCFALHEAVGKLEAASEAQPVAAASPQTSE
jgi:hypothetical protein